MEMTCLGFRRVGGRQMSRQHHSTNTLTTTFLSNIKLQQRHQLKFHDNICKLVISDNKTREHHSKNLQTPTAAKVFDRRRRSLSSYLNLFLKYSEISSLIFHKTCRCYPGGLYLTLFYCLIMYAPPPAIFTLPLSEIFRNFK